MPSYDFIMGFAIALVYIGIKDIAYALIIIAEEKKKKRNANRNYKKY